MNLLARKKESGLLLIAGLMLVWGCKEDLGIDLPPDVQRTEVKVDSLTLPVTNVFFDSLRTDKESVFMTGSYTDPVYGSLTTKAFTEFAFKSVVTASPDTLRWIRKQNFSDSVADRTFEARLVLDVDRVLTDDDFFNQYLELRILEDSVFSEAIYLSHRSIGESTLIGEGAISIPNLSLAKFDSTKFIPVAVNFNEDFSENLYYDFKATNNKRRRGFSVTATSGNGIGSFDLSSDTTEIQLFMRANLYDTTGVASIKKDTLITVGYFRLSSSNHFTQVIRDRSGSASSGVADKTTIELSEDFAYFNELAGIYPKIDLAPFIEFAETVPGAFINRATLSIEVETNTANVPHMRTINYYFSNSSDAVNINWPGIFQVPGFYRTILQNDARYLSPSSQISSVAHQLDTLNNANTLGYKGTPTIFWQYIYDNAIYDWNEVAVDKRPTIHQYLADVKNLVMINSNKLSLGRSSIKKDGIKLKIYYTKPRE